jgi:outer membrane protein OmpA-like peptidoglycan-associated protein
MNRFLYILFLSGVISISGFGQKIVPTPEDLYSDASEFINSGDYRDALLMLHTLEGRGYNTANINYKIAECLLNIPGQQTKSIPYLKNAAENISEHYQGNSLDETYAPEKVLLYLGIANRLNYDFDNAIASFNDYIRTLDDSDTENIRLTEYHIERCNNAREMIASPAVFSADTLSGIINTSFSSFNPLVTADEKEVFYMKQLKFYDAIMLAKRTDVGWNEPDNLTPQVKSDGDHYVTGVSEDGTRLWLNFYNPYKSGEIYATTSKNGEWAEMQKLNDTINTIFNETHAAVSPDGNILYFTSDRKGGYGGLDIYQAGKNESGDWDKPVNLGPLINTPYNEESPFISSDGDHLFFSSQGHYNMGGYDVFCSVKGSDGKWLPPVNIGFPLNTTGDDLFWFPVDTGNIGYASRFSPQSSVASIVRYVVKSFGNPSRYVVTGNIELKADKGFDPSSVRVAFINKPGEDTVASRFLNADGSFIQKVPAGNYSIDFENGSQKLHSKRLSIPDYFPQRNLVLHEIVTVPSTAIAFDTLIVSDILFDFNAERTSEEDLIQLSRLIEVLKKYPEITVIVNGYTDAVGSETYNKELSAKRAGNVSTYLGEQIAPQRISANGYGEDHPVALNKLENGRDNPEGRRYNRRVEIILVNIPDNLIVIKHVDIPEAIMQK